MKKTFFVILAGLAPIVLTPMVAFADNGSSSTSYTTSTSLSDSSQSLKGLMWGGPPTGVPGTVTDNGTTQVTNASSFTCSGMPITSGNGIQVQRDAGGTYNVDITGQQAIFKLQSEFPNTMKSLISGSDRFGSGGTSMNQAILPCNAAITVPTSTAEKFVAGTKAQDTIYTLHLIHGISRTDQYVTKANSIINGAYSDATSGKVSSLYGTKQYCTGMPPILPTDVNQTVNNLAPGVYQLIVPSGTSSNVNFQCAGVWKINMTIHFTDGTNQTIMNWKTLVVKPNTLLQDYGTPPPPQPKPQTGGLAIIK